MQKFDTKKLYVFFWNFTRKGIEKLCSIDLSSIPKTQKNELAICPQDEFEFVKYLVDNDTQKYKSFDIPKQAHFSAEKMVENFVNSSKKTNCFDKLSSLYFIIARTSCVRKNRG